MTITFSQELLMWLWFLNGFKMGPDKQFITVILYVLLGNVPEHSTQAILF